MKKILLVVVFALLVIGMAMAVSRVNQQDEVLHQGKSWFGGGIQVVKSATAGSSLKRVWDKRLGMDKNDTKDPSLQKAEKAKFVLYGIQASSTINSPYAKGGFGTEAKSYGLSRYIMKRFIPQALEPKAAPKTGPLIPNSEPQNASAS